ncbi:MAG: hypothetical protein NTW21_42005 [Verrucomicrobia bacterium]|nr:hypothetical protein [Verrucomicrobiota bacterium]
MQAPKHLLILSHLLTSLPLAGGDIYLPTDFGVARTPETRSLTAEEESQAMGRDWLFQAMGEPLMQRSAKEIAWTRELAARLKKMSPAPNLRSQCAGGAGEEQTC